VAEAFGDPNAPSRTMWRFAIYGGLVKSGAAGQPTIQADAVFALSNPPPRVLPDPDYRQTGERPAGAGVGVGQTRARGFAKQCSLTSPLVTSDHGRSRCCRLFFIHERI
jgi:hypothetical protein